MSEMLSLTFLADGELHPARNHNKRYLHGVLLSRHKALGHALYPQPFWNWKPESGRWVSSKLQTLEHIVHLLCVLC